MLCKQPHFNFKNMFSEKSPGAFRDVIKNEIDDVSPTA